MDDLCEAVISRELGSSERLLWAGRPRQGIFLRAADGYAIPFSLLWGGFAIFWEILAINAGAPLFFALFGVPFVLVGLYMIVGRFFVDAWQRSATVYGVTNERILIISGLLSRRVQSLTIDTLTNVSLTERWGGGGIIAFGPLPFMAGTFIGPEQWPGNARYYAPCFELTEEARTVYDVIRDAQRQARQHGEPRADEPRADDSWRDERFRAP